VPAGDPLNPAWPGHDYDYERSYLVRGTDPGTFLRPSGVSTDVAEVDTSRGLVHIVLGGGGTPSHDDVYGPPDTATGDPLTSQIYTEPQPFRAVADESVVATWSAVRDPDTTFPWGIGAGMASVTASTAPSPPISRLSPT
jgi:hypothetical protein